MGSLRGRRGCVCDGGSVRRTSEAEVGLVAWIEGREERLRLREKKKRKEKERRQRQRRRCGRKSEPKKKRGKTSRDRHKKGSGWEGK